MNNSDDKLIELKAKLNRLKAWVRKYRFGYTECPCCGRCLVTHWCKADCELGEFMGTTRQQKSRSLRND